MPARSPFRAPASPAISVMNCGRRRIARSICGICCSRRARSMASGRSERPRSTWRASKRASSSPIWISSPPNRRCAGRARSPFEMGLDWMIDFDKGHFNGRRALLAEKAKGNSKWALGRARHRRQCRGRAFAHLSQQEARSRAYDRGDLVADDQAQHRARHAGAALSRHERTTISGLRSMPCANCSITSSWSGPG